MNVIRTLAFAIAFTVVGGSFPGLSLAQESAGTITVGVGEVIVIRAAGGEEQAVEGTVIYQHDEIYVGPDGEATIVFVDETVLTLGALTALIIDELVYDPSGQDSSASFNLVGGLMGLVSGDIVKTGEMTVTTPDSTIEIRGTAALINTFVQVRRTSFGLYKATATGTQGETISLLLDANGAYGEIKVTDSSGTSWLTVAGSSLIGGVRATMDAAQVQAAFGKVLTALQNATGADLGVTATETLEQAIEELLELLDEENPDQDASPE